MLTSKSYMWAACMSVVLWTVAASEAGAGGCCATACGEPCCAACPPPPVTMVLCVQEPCTCCTHEVTVCVPACCQGQEACVSWRRGLFGRQIATCTWACCGYRLEIVITKHGRVIVRQ